MDIFTLFTFAGGLGLFLFGMNVLGDSIGRQAGGRMKTLLERIVSNRFAGVLLGALVTAIIQSSGATTVMILGFINSGIMTLETSVSLIFGANIGTTATAWLLALNDVSGTGFLLRLLNPDSFVPVLSFLGAVMLVFCKSDRTRDIGTILLGFGVLMFGMGFMSDSMAPLKESQAFREILSVLDDPFLGVLAGFAVAAVLQSSSASVGIVQAAAVTGAVTVANSLPLIMGVNVGAGLIVMLASAGTARDAKRGAWVYMLHNVFAMIVTLIPLVILELTGTADFLYRPVSAFGIALLHTCYKTANTAVQLPFVRQIVWLTGRIVRPRAEEERFALLDENFLKTPPVAVARCGELTNEMAEKTRDSVLKAVRVVRKFDAAAAKEIRDLESEVDRFEDQIGNYLVKLSGYKLATADSRKVTKLLHSISDLERISDYAQHLSYASEDLEERGKQFKPQVMGELELLLRACEEVVNLTTDAFVREDSAVALRVEPLEQVVDELQTALRSRHIQRLKSGECSMFQSMVFTDIVTDLERISGHCSNIAVSVLQMHHDEYEPHSYEAQLRVSDTEYNRLYAEYLKKYSP